MTNYLVQLLRKVEILLDDLRLYNPKYRYAWDVGDNFVVSEFSKALGYNPCYFALPTQRGVTFDIPKIERVKAEITILIEKCREVQIENQ